MERKASARTGSIGVTQTQLAVQSKLDWLFREQPNDDYGIDAQVEVVDGKYVRGRLLALQIKSGESFFREPTPGGWWFRPESKHVQYWMNHSLPVVVILYHPDTQTCHWQLASSEHLMESSRGGWKLLVPKRHVLDESACRPLARAALGNSYSLRIRDLRLSRPWMELLGNGERLVIDIQEWVNKISGRGTISLGIDHKDGNAPESIARWDVYLGSEPYSEAVPPLFAWADVTLHEETYQEAEYDWTPGQLEDLRPYANACGEIEYWRLELTLNDLGKAFLLVDQFAANGWGLLSRPSGSSKEIYGFPL
ncbi:DUF4365 domain-containing protein [Streptomyces sp. NPDC047453]|uniref:DUF4365 domain-containing protein n=1 Tax=Streptomyces sp. NPDC047453 TaxID=3154812 RepID=UPI00340C9E24